jgi:hypothetical protein
MGSEDESLTVQGSWETMEPMNLESRPATELSHAPDLAFLK